jgi:hypothetical protein
MEREREGREREEGVGAGHQVGRFKVSLSLGEIEGRDRDTEIQRYRDIKTKRHRDRADIKIPSKAG